MVEDYPCRHALLSLLHRELGDAVLAHTFSNIVLSDVLRWRPPAAAPKELQTIVVYTFGNRMDPNGNRAPGPVNEALAEIVVRLHEEIAAPVYAQWEVAEAIGTRVASQHLVSITPLRDARAEPVYLSTGGVASAIVERVGDPNLLGKVAVVGFADHINRCVDTSRRVGMDAVAPAGYDMPTTYDVHSGQAWTRSRLAYLLHDVMCRLEDRRNELIAGA